MHDKLTISLFEFGTKFKTDEDASLFLEEQRWHGQRVCPYCGTVTGQYAQNHAGRNDCYEFGVGNNN